MARNCRVPARYAEADADASSPPPNPRARRGRGRRQNPAPLRPNSPREEVVEETQPAQPAMTNANLNDDNPALVACMAGFQRALDTMAASFSRSIEVMAGAMRGDQQQNDTGVGGEPQEVVNDIGGTSRGRKGDSDLIAFMKLAPPEFTDYSKTEDPLDFPEGI